MTTPIDDRAVVARLVADGQVRSAIDPSSLPAPRGGSPAWERVAGVLYGLAIGDALGNTSESRTPAQRRSEHGEVRNYLPNRHAGGRAVGLPSDDTQLACWTLEQLLEDGGLVPENLARRFATSGRIFGVGSTMRSFLRAYNAGAPWLEAAQESAGNGALMRIAPVLLPHLRAPSTALWADALLGGAVTHNDFASNACCVAFVRMLWEALFAQPPVPPGFWLSAFEPVAHAERRGSSSPDSLPAPCGFPTRSGASSVSGRSGGTDGQSVWTPVPARELRNLSKSLNVPSWSR